MYLRAHARLHVRAQVSVRPPEKQSGALCELVEGTARVHFRTESFEGLGISPTKVPWAEPMSTIQ